jgi:hypothetical protein
MDSNTFQLLFLSVPFVCLTIMYIVLAIVNRKSTAEMKWILPPEILLKVFAVLLLVTVIFVLATTKLISEATVGALLGAVVTGTLTIPFGSKKD